MVMIGGMLSGSDECEGQWIDEPNGTKSLLAYGMSSQSAMEKYNGGMNSYRASEGRTTRVPHKGPVEAILQQILGGLRSTCSYTNSRNLIELSQNSKFVRVNNTHNKILENFTIGI
jgi:GMP reductase